MKLTYREREHLTQASFLIAFYLHEPKERDGGHWLSVVLQIRILRNQREPPITVQTQKFKM